MWVYIWNRLPSEYQEVEYIQSSWTQWIDTLFTPTPKTKISIDMQFTSTATQQRLFWVWTPSTSYMTFNAYINWSTQWSRAVQNGEWTWQSTGVSADTTRHIFELDNSTYKIYTNWTQVHSSSNSTTSTTSCSHSLPLLANYYEWWVYSQASAKLYWCKLWDNWTLVRDFIPCYRKSDSVVGLYDLVNNQFYTNSWTGTFSKWSDVNTYRESSLKNAYIGEVYEYSYDFRNKSSTILTNDWWTVGANTTIDSNGIISSSYSSTTHLIWKSIANAKKMVLTCWLYNAINMNSSYWLWATTSSVGTHYISFYEGASSSDNSSLALDWAAVQQFLQQEPSWQSEWTYTLDFENLTYNFEYAGVTKSWTMTQTQADNIRNNNTALRIATQWTWRIQYIKIFVWL